MDHEGPPLQLLLRRIAETPPDFLAEPRIGARGAVEVAAVVRDLLERLGDPASGFDPAAYSGRGPADRGWSGILLLLCWLLDEAALRPAATGAARTVLDTLPRELASYTHAAQLVADGDRREELARLALARLGLRPAGESLAQAQDRLSTISSVERARVIAASRAAEQRAREVREALARKAAEESADKWGRE